MEDADLCVRMHMAGPAPIHAAGYAGAEVWALAMPACMCKCAFRVALK
jgi:hypothetical protein